MRLLNMQISKLVAAGRDLWSKATGDWSAEDYLDKLNWLAESGRERKAAKEARRREMGDGGGGERENLKEVIGIETNGAEVRDSWERPTLFLLTLLRQRCHFFLQAQAVSNPSSKHATNSPLTNARKGNVTFS